MLSKAFYAIFLFSFLLDILLKNNEKDFAKPNASENTQQEDLIPNEITEKIEKTEVHEKKKINEGSSLKIKNGDEDLKVKMEGGDKEQYTGEKIVLSIQYCTGSNNIKNYEELRKQLLETYQNVEVYGAEFPLPMIRKVLSK